MIESNLGKVTFPRANYDLCDTLNCSKEDIDRVIETTILADLTAILISLGKKYDPVKAMEMWLTVIDIALESEE